MADSAEPPCFVLPFCNRDFPLLAAETLATETGAEDLGSLRAANARLRREHKLFREGLLKEGRQMLHLVDALPLPLTHCPTCWRAADKLPWTKARLALRQCGSSAASPPPLLRRITGAVFSALAGHRPPFCCDVAWCSLDVQEAYARYLVGRGEVVEAPLNPGCDPTFSYVGGSLRVLPTARLDFYTQCWQAKHGVDSKPLYEMLQAVRSLLDLKLSLNAVPCSLGGEAMTVKATAALHDFSRCFLAADGESDVMALMGQLSFSFRRADGGEAAAVVLPSRHCVLAVVNGCQKGRLPRVQGAAAYVKRRHALRPDVGHVLARPDGVLECVWVSEAMPSGRKSRFLMEAKQGGGGGAGLLFSVWSPCTATAEPKSVQESLQASLTSRPCKRKKTWDFVPLVSWLGWVLSAAALVSTDDFMALTETVAQQLKARLEAAAPLLPSGQLPVRFLDNLLQDLVAEATRRRWAILPFGFGRRASEGVSIFPLPTPNPQPTQPLHEARSLQSRRSRGHRQLLRQAAAGGRREGLVRSARLRGPAGGEGHLGAPLQDQAGRRVGDEEPGVRRAPMALGAARRSAPRAVKGLEEGSGDAAAAAAASAPEAGGPCRRGRQRGCGRASGGGRVRRPQLPLPLRRLALQPACG